MSEKLDHVKARLEVDIPELSLESIKQIGSGWDNIAYLVNGKFIFRVPKDNIEPPEIEHLKKQNQAEVKLLNALNGKLPIVTPKPVHIAPDYSYFSYQFMPGINMKENDSHYQSPKQISHFMNVWMQTAVAINAQVPPNEARKIGITALDGIARREGYAKTVLRAGILDPAANSLVKYVLDNYAKHWRAVSPENSITMHADMGMSNWLLDDKQEPYALIDWSDTCIAPPEHQLRLWVWYEQVDEAARRWTELTGYTPDKELIYLDSFADAIWDMGDIIESGSIDNNAWFQQCVGFLTKWSTRLPLL